MYIIGSSTISQFIQFIQLRTSQKPCLAMYLFVWSTIGMGFELSNILSKNFAYLYTSNIYIYIKSKMLDVWNIYRNSPKNWPKCRLIFHTWSIWLYVAELFYDFIWYGWYGLAPCLWPIKTHSRWFNPPSLPLLMDNRNTNDLRRNRRSKLGHGSSYHGDLQFWPLTVINRIVTPITSWLYISTISFKTVKDYNCILL